MNEYLADINREFIKHADEAIAAGQAAYMKNKFEFFGVKAPVRKEIQKQYFAKDKLPAKSGVEKIVKEMWGMPQREFQYFAMELCWKYKRQTEKRDIDLMEFMVINKSWWDTVDMVAGRLMGAYFLKYTDVRKIYVDKWISSGNIWLQRSAILFQLNYKEKTDTALLSQIILSLNGTEEFFINKAIGWVLRNYSKVNPDWVKQFVEETPLSNLSRREALRLLK